MAKTVITARVEPEVLDLIDRICAAQGRSRSWFAASALKRIAEEEAAFLAFVQEGIDSLDRGEGIPHDTVMAEIDAMIAARQAELDTKVRAA
jgi:predicted transcriptional regulator